MCASGCQWYCGMIRSRNSDANHSSFSTAITGSWIHLLWGCQKWQLTADEEAGDLELRDEIEAEIEATLGEEPADEEVTEAGSADAEATAEPEAAPEGARPRRRRRRRRRAGDGRAGAAMQATFDHGADDGFGLWLDPAVEDDPVYAEHWAGHRQVEVTIEPDRIVIRRV